MKIKVVLETSDEGGYTVHVPSLPGCISEGDNKQDALDNIREAIEPYLEPIGRHVGETTARQAGANLPRSS